MHNSQKKDLTGADALDKMCDYMRLEAKNLGFGKIYYPGKEKSIMVLTIHNGLTTQVELEIQNKTKTFRAT